MANNNLYTTQEAVNVLAQGTGGASSGGTSTGAGTVVKAVTHPQANKVTRTNNQVSDLITDENENLWNREAYAPLYEDNVAGVAKVEERFSPAYISTATTTTVKSGSGFLHRIIVNGGTTGTIIIYDNTAASGTIIASFDTTNAIQSIELNVTFTTGLTIVTSAATKVTVAYR